MAKKSFSFTVMVNFSTVLDIIIRSRITETTHFLKISTFHFLPRTRMSLSARKLDSVWKIWADLELGKMDIKDANIIFQRMLDSNVYERLVIHCSLAFSLSSKLASP